MKKLLVILVSVLAISTISCKNNKNNEELNGAHKVVVEEVLQANAYTYLNVTENGNEQWIAVTRIDDVKKGDTFYYKDFMEMKNFESKDLNRTFESVYFIQDLKRNAEGFQAMSQQPQMPEGHVPVGGEHQGTPNVAQESIEIEPVDGGITIQELYSNAAKYDGQQILVKGKVVKTNYGIMDKNWFHIQDGTAADDKFDLTITSVEEGVNVGDVVVFEGTVTLNKDFGHGYSYEILLEEGTLK